MEPAPHSHHSWDCLGCRQGWGRRTNTRRSSQFLDQQCPQDPLAEAKGKGDTGDPCLLLCGLESQWVSPIGARTLHSEGGAEGGRAGPGAFL